MSFKAADAENEYIKNIKLKRNDVQALREWLKKQPHLPELTELQVILFLTSCHHRIEAAKAKIDNYFTIRTHCFDLFKAANEDVIRHTQSTESVVILPRRTPEGFAILSAKLVDYAPEKYICVNHLKVATMIMTLYMHQHGSVEGFIFLFDTKGATLGHLARANFAAIKQVLHFVQEAAPVRIQSIQYVNVDPLTEKIVGFVKPFLKSEFFNLIKFHSSLESLYKNISKEYLPEDYDGDLPPLKVLLEENVQNLIANLDYFKWHDTQKTDESKRLGKSETNTNFGTEGSFKKLEVD